MCRRLYIALFILALPFVAHGQSDTTPLLKGVGYARLLEKKIGTYQDRLTGRTEKALVRLSRWEDRLQRILEKSSPAMRKNSLATGNPPLAVCCSS